MKKTLLLAVITILTMLFAPLAFCQTGVIGLGGSTANVVDRDGDGYGIGPPVILNTTVSSTINSGTQTVTPASMVIGATTASTYNYTGTGVTVTTGGLVTENGGSAFIINSVPTVGKYIVIPGAGCPTVATVANACTVANVNGGTSLQLGAGSYMAVSGGTATWATHYVNFASIATMEPGEAVTAAINGILAANTTVVGSGTASGLGNTINDVLLSPAPLLPFSGVTITLSIGVNMRLRVFQLDSNGTPQGPGNMEYVQVASTTSTTFTATFLFTHTYASGNPIHITDLRSLGPDADDLDATVHMAAQGIAEYGTLTTFIKALYTSARGYTTSIHPDYSAYNPAHYWCLSPSGVDGAIASSSTADAACASPYQTWAHIAGSVAGGDMVIMRSGFNDRITPPSGSSGSPTILLGYPGEWPAFDSSVIPPGSACGPAIATCGIFISARHDIVLDGVRFQNDGVLSMGDSSYFLTAHDFHDIILRHIDGGGGILPGNEACWVQQEAGFQNLFIEDTACHDSAEHGMYVGAAFIPATGLHIWRNVLFNNGWSGFGGAGIHVNGLVPGAILSQNYIIGSSIDGLDLQSGISSAQITSNVIVSTNTTNDSIAVILDNYKDGTDCNGGVNVIGSDPCQVNGATWSAGTATLSFSNPGSDVDFFVGSYVYVFGINPSGYNCLGVLGCQITAVDRSNPSNPKISYAVASNPGSYVSGGIAGMGVGDATGNLIENNTFISTYAGYAAFRVVNFCVGQGPPYCPAGNILVAGAMDNQTLRNNIFISNAASVPGGPDSTNYPHTPVVFDNSLDPAARYYGANYLATATIDHNLFFDLNDPTGAHQWAIAQGNRCGSTIDQYATYSVTGAAQQAGCSNLTFTTGGLTGNVWGDPKMASSQSAMLSSVFSEAFDVQPLNTSPAYATGSTTSLPAYDVYGHSFGSTPSMGAISASTAPPPAGTPTTLTMISGNNQSGSVSTQLSGPFVARVTDANGNPVSGVTVTFGGGTLLGGTGSPSVLPVTTSTSGNASATLTLGSVTGTETVTASTAGLFNSPLTFTATAISAPPPSGTPTALTMVSGNNQSGSVSTQLSSSFLVKVTDSNGNPVSGVAVTFAVTSGGGTLVGGGGTPSSLQVTTDGSGTASATLVLGSGVGSDTVTASAASLSNSPLTFTATASAPSSPPPPTSTSTPVPAGTWVTALTDGYTAQVVGWEHLIWVPTIQKAVMLGGYRDFNSEPNTGLVAYDFQANRWDVLDVFSPFHTENHPEAGHPAGSFGFNPVTGWITYKCCYSGSSVAEDTGYTYVFDPIGQVGRNLQTSPMAPYELTGMGDFDLSTNLLVTYDANSGQTWTYNSSTNTWTQESTTCTGSACYLSGAPPGRNMGAMEYDSANHLSYMFGGYNGPTYFGDLLSYNSSTKAWTQLSPTCPCPGPRAFPGFAYDSIHNVFLLFGGTNNFGVTAFSDTWIYDPTANAWTQLSPAASPSLAFGAAVPMMRLTFDPDDNVFLLAMNVVSGNMYNGGVMNFFPTQMWFFRYSGTGPDAGNAPVSYAAPAGSLNKNPGAEQAAGNVWTAGWAQEPSVATDGTSLFTAWAETGTPFAGDNSQWMHIFVKNASTGAFLGGAYNSISIDHGAAEKPSLAFAGSTLWEAHSEANYAEAGASYVVAKQWNGAAWVGGPVGFMTGSNCCTAGISQLSAIGSTPYLALIEDDRLVGINEKYIYVASYNGSSWSALGGTKLNRTGAGTVAESVSITNNGTNPIVAWAEFTAAGGAFPPGVVATPTQIYVSQWNGSAWTPLGGSLNRQAADWASSPSIIYYQGQPTVFWNERSTAGINQLYGSTWNGTLWVPLGSGALNNNAATGWAFGPSTTTDQTNLYVSWVEQVSGQPGKVFVAKWNGTAWTSLGTAPNVGAGSAQTVRLAVIGSTLAAAFSQVSYGTTEEVFGEKLSGSTWSLLSTTGPSAAGPCDINGDGVVNSIDVTAAIDQAVGIASCSTANLQGNGQCNVVDVQRVINATMGQACLTGP